MAPYPECLMEEEKSSILIVDDLQIHLELMEAIFEKEGCRVVTAHNADEALRLLEKSSSDMAILDVMMPGMNGYELCRRLKEKSGARFFPVILVTSLSELEDKIAGIEAGADDFITKPFKSIELTTKVRSLLKFKKLQEELDHSESVIITLAIALESKDPYTKGHSERVGNLSAEFASIIGFQEKEQNLIRKAGVLHDIGKIGVEDSILHKRNILTKEELHIVEQHTIIGEKICRPLHSLSVILPVIRHHHERWDGAGFPDGLKGEQIPVMARILSIVDTFDAMASERPYRRPISIEKALKKMEEEKNFGQWDPVLLERFVEMMMGKS
ncbi:MAG: metal-dependent phosphohydrolase [Nitrospirae bacterium CG22_combo_CG10-13_8_21_14_all_44_11]|nr:MAG: metal-dependent phosphohydrolase [Nitrospirae bacterium CG22_combo_CG10-13_8_21_14_all_44_11]PIV66169.1 MAG: metal-dependent phosphohydrolase [Nitrospirae bacterium CG01_land_8_20_14_3_00_44_22]PJA83655.1 MAG: metal-dependent phosphohydrolase [Nitrospirae bacterium CG_4_9_14_3_um_filter_44_28]